MATDFSRLRFSAANDHSSVLLKQGAVLLDADANEGAAIVDRRFRALASDLGGPALVSKTTPHAFEIKAEGPIAQPTLSIGVGRLYVDGLLAENHGSASSGAVFDRLLGEPKFEGAVSYTEQPYLPAAPAFPPPGKHIVYLDVWQRELTHVERPDLIEIAVGIETSSRLQTVWQVRVLPIAGPVPVTCATAPQEWLNLIAPSTGLLSTGHVPVPVLDDPCELPPTGGYRGLENQLYRIEIHDAGLPGQGATFKWSRENSSVACGVEEVLSAGRLQLQSLGRDDVLGFAAGDWIEVTNDEREFSQTPGELRKIALVRQDTRVIELTEDLPTPLAPVGVVTAGTGLRIKRWDHKQTIQQVGPSSTLLPFHDVDAPSATFPGIIAGVIPVPALGTELVLEHGLTVSFDSSVGAGFKPGDYWVVAARTADAEAERLDRAPPRGTHHHFARLAVWDSGTGQVTDCRVVLPPSGPPAQPAHDCSCTVCVTPGGDLTIQAAVDLVKETGGTVCLAPGFYDLADPVQIVHARSVRIRGQSPPSKLQTPHRVGSVLSCSRGVFAVMLSDGVVLEDLLLQSLSSATGIAGSAAVFVENSSNVTLQGLAIEADQLGIEMRGAVPNLRIAKNEVRAATGIVGRGVSHEDNAPAPLHRSSLLIEDNWIDCKLSGVSLQLVAKGDTLVTRNKVQGSAKEAINVENASDEANASSTTISENHLEVSKGRGIGCVAQRMSIRENRLVVVATDAAIVVQSESGECHLIDNHVQVTRDGPALRSNTRSVIIKGNQVQLPNTRIPGLLVQAKKCLFHDNLVEVQTRADAPSVDLSASDQVTLLGNITDGRILPPNGGATPSNWPDFNIINL